MDPMSSDGCGGYRKLMWSPPARKRGRTRRTNAQLHILNKSPFGQRRDDVAGDDQMIEHPDLDERQRVAQASGDDLIRLGRLGDLCPGPVRCGRSAWPLSSRHPRPPQRRTRRPMKSGSSTSPTRAAWITAARSTFLRAGNFRAGACRRASRPSPSTSAALRPRWGADRHRQAQQRRSGRSRARRSPWSAGAPAGLTAPRGRLSPAPAPDRQSGRRFNSGRARHASRLDSCLIPSLHTKRRPPLRSKKGRSHLLPEFSSRHRRLS